MNNYKDSQNSIVAVFLVMGFVVVVALIFRPQGAIQLKFGETQLEIDRSSDKSP